MIVSPSYLVFTTNQVLLKHCPRWERFVTEYRSLLVRIQKRYGVVRPKMPFSTAACNDYLDHKESKKRQIIKKWSQWHGSEINVRWEISALFAARIVTQIKYKTIDTILQFRLRVSKIFPTNFSMQANPFHHKVVHLTRL